MTKTIFEQLLHALNFTKNGKHYSKTFANGAILAADLDKKELIYPKSQGLIVHDATTSNFSAAENFVVFECVYRLLEKGYAPESIELEPKWKIGHSASGGKADILVKDRQGDSLLIIECKTADKEFNEAWEKTRLDGGQLFSYVQQEKSVKFICLYASDFSNGKLTFDNYLIDLRDNEQQIKEDAKKSVKRLFFKDATDANGLFRAWSETYNQNYSEFGIFEPTMQTYQIGVGQITHETLKDIDDAELKTKFNEFAEVLRTFNVSSKETAFDKLINLFLCKIVDETMSEKNHSELKFFWRGKFADDYFDLIDRLQSLYQQGMKDYLGENITFIDRATFLKPFEYFKHNENAIRDEVLKLFTEQKYYTNSDFSFIDVHNEKLFKQNMEILLAVMKMWQGFRLTSNTQNQFLGNLFELFLDKGFKQSEGQFFTPIPICRFIISALPLEKQITENEKPPRVIDYACGCGHFLTEYANQVEKLIAPENKAEYFRSIYGVEKEYRLSKVAKISAFMYGQKEINVIYCDALNPIVQEIHDKKIAVENETLDILVANPPFAVDGFLTTLKLEQREKFELFKTVSDVTSNGNIQCFFIERAMQLLKPKGIAAIIVPSSVLSNSDKTHIACREILLKAFDIVAIVELGSGTFGKTGTNTVILFLRRKQRVPSEFKQYGNRVNQWFYPPSTEDDVFDDRHFINKYCAHIGIPFEQYETLLNGKPSAELLAHEMFVDYRKDFDNSSDITKLKTQKFFKDFTEQQKQTEFDKRFCAYLERIEKDKLLYFVLAFDNPKPVLIIKSPTDNKEQKAFLGYEWSGRKGDEGIKLSFDSNGKHLTPLYDETNRDNPEKINALITQNFLGKLSAIPEVLQPFASQLNLVDMLDFSRKDFDKTISLTVKKTVEIESIFPLVKLGSFCEVIAGQSPESENYNEEKSGLPFYQGKKDFGDIFLKKPVVWTTKTTKESLKNDVLISVRAPVGDVNINPFEKICIGRGLAAIRTNNLDSQKFLFEFISQNQSLFKGNRGTTFDSISTSDLREIKIPLPPLEIQQQIVSECEAIDGEVEKANLEIQTAKTAIDETVQRCFNGNFILEKLEKVLALEYGKPLPEKQRTAGEYPVMGSNGISGYHNEFLVEAPAIIVGRKGSAGKVVYIEQNCFPIDTTFYIKSIKPCSMKYLYYILLAMKLEKMIKGIGVPGINRNDVYQLQIPVPDLATQQKLVSEIEAFEKQIDEAQNVIDGAASKKAAILKKFLTQ